MGGDVMDFGEILYVEGEIIWVFYRSMGGRMDYIWKRVKYKGK